MTPPIFLTPEMRLEAAIKNLEQLNTALPQGMAPIQPPPWTDLTASVDAVIRVLIKNDLISQDEFLAAKTERMAELLEQMVVLGREAKRRVTGLVIAGAGQV